MTAGVLGLGVQFRGRAATVLIDKHGIIAEAALTLRCERNRALPGAVDDNRRWIIGTADIYRYAAETGLAAPHRHLSQLHQQLGDIHLIVCVVARVSG